MKRIYQKPDVYFEDFAFSSNIANSCSSLNGIQSQDSNCLAYGTHADAYSCVFIDNGWIVFHEGNCLTYPQENDPGNLCYHVSTDETRMFAS